MNKKIYIIKLILILFAASFFSSCKKDNSVTKQCKIISGTYQNGTTTTSFSISYTENGKPSVVTSKTGANTYIRAYTYDVNSITAISVNSLGAFNDKTVVTLNGINKIINIRSFSNASGTNWDNTQIFYDNSGKLLKSIATNSYGNSSYTSNYTVSNGDIITSEEAGATNSFEYYNDKQFQVGDYFGFNALTQFGVLDGGYLKNAHLTKSILGSGSISPAQFSYQMDNNGLISILTISNTNVPYTISYSYQYECN